MKKLMIFYIALALLVIFLAVIFLLQAKSSVAPPINPQKFISISINNKTYNLEVASGPAVRQKGLMNRPTMAENSGMLFVFDGTGLYPFWMKNTLISLDMIWLNKEKEIVHIKENAQPCASTIEAICQSIVPLKPALYVIELNAGEVEKLGLKIGDKIEFSLN